MSRAIKRPLPEPARCAAGSPPDDPGTLPDDVWYNGPVVTCYLAAPGFTPELVAELGHPGGPRIRSVTDRLVITEGEPVAAVWAQNVWYDAATHRFTSVGDAVRILRGIQRSWAKYSIRSHRRAELIQARLPPVSTRPIPPFSPVPTSPLGSWTLLDEHTLLAAPRCSSPFPNGEVLFEEDRSGPPSRAYLKLWELFTTRGFRPDPGDRCLDLGSSPGGWTWVLAGLGARVTSVDKALLDPAVTAMEGVTHRSESAFGLDPETVGEVDWLFSDVICYPERLLGLVERWIASGRCRNLVATLKFQGETDHETVRRFARIPGSVITHLWHNRHELTWYRLGGSVERE